MTGDTIQIATPSSSAPKNRFTATIQRPRLRQQRAFGGADDDERHAHPEREREERRAAEEGIAGLADVEEGAGERRSDAWAHDRGREHAHQRDRAERAALQLELVALTFDCKLAGSCRS